jgi:hypothetical protein
METTAHGNGHAKQIYDVKVETEVEPRRGWFTRMVTRYVAKRAARGKHINYDHSNAHERAHMATRWACIKSALAGVATGSISTGATIITAETQGIGAFVAIPVAGLTIGGEMLMRSLLHLDLTWNLAEIYGVHFDPNDDGDVWRLYALAFKTHEHDEESEDPGKQLVHEVTHVEGEEVGDQIGRKVLGESVMQSVVPFVSIFYSAIRNYQRTKHLGETVRHYMRYQRALNDAFGLAETLCAEHLDLLVEGFWFIFSADGKLLPEEAAMLAHFLQRFEGTERHAIMHRFTDDEMEWCDRISREVPEGIRDAFMHALEVAASVDKSVSLPERKILRRAARALGREFDLEKLEQMISEFETTGVLGDVGRDIAR